MKSNSSRPANGYLLVRNPEKLWEEQRMLDAMTDEERAEYLGPPIVEE